MPRPSTNPKNALFTAVRQTRAQGQAQTNSQYSVYVDPTEASGDSDHNYAVLVEGWLYPITGIEAYGIAVWESDAWVQLTGASSAPTAGAGIVVSGTRVSLALFRNGTSYGVSTDTVIDQDGLWEATADLTFTLNYPPFGFINVGALVVLFANGNTCPVVGGSATYVGPSSVVGNATLLIAWIASNAWVAIGGMSW